MLVFPAIDISKGKCVRLVKGNFKKKTVFNSSPLRQAIKFEKFGFKKIHIVNLDGSLGFKKINHQQILRIIRKTKLHIQLGGGIRTLRDVQYWLKNGVSNVVLSSMMHENFNEFKLVVALYSKKISFAIDLRGRNIFYKGWTIKKKINLKKFLKRVYDIGIKNIILTDIDRDGTKSGVDIKNLKKILIYFKYPIIYSGGISSKKDLLEIKKLKLIKGIIVGKALYEMHENLSWKDLLVK